MYLKEEVIKLEIKTRTLLASAKKGLKESQIEDLRSILKFHEYRYYIENDPLIADSEYDLALQGTRKIRDRKSVACYS